MTYNLPILWSFRRCPYAMRARLALDASRQQCELREVVLRDKPEEMLRASPKGTVPILVDVDGTVIDESLDIMLWALRRNDVEQWLVDVDETIALVRHFDTHFKQHLDRYKYPQRFTDADAMASRAQAAADLDKLESRLRTAEFLCGEKPALLDMALAPFIRQFANVDAAWFASQPWTRVQRWLSTITHSERFVRIMRPLEPWTPGTAGVLFPFENG